MHPLYFCLEPLDGPQSSAGMFLVVWPEANPDRTMLDVQAGDVLVHKREQYRVVAVQRFNDWTGA